MNTTIWQSCGLLAASRAVMLALMFWTLSGTAFAQDTEFEACALLDDPETRSLLSGAMEIKLGVLCGTDEATLKVDSLRPEESPAPDAAEAPDDKFNSFFKKRDRLVNDPGQDVANFTQSETSIAAGRKSTLCAAWNDAGQLRNIFAFGLSGFADSQNLGRTWTDGGFFPPGPPPPNSGLPDANFGDPSLAYSRRDKAFYYAALSIAGLSLWKSNDHCRSFQYVGPIHVGFGDDKELMAVDNNVFSPYYGRLYVGWTNFAAFPDRNQTTYSDDGGATWSIPANLPNSGTRGQGMWPAVAPNGDVFFALENRCFFVGCLHDQWIYRSTDGGNSWAQASDIDTATRQPQNAAATAACGRGALNGDIRYLSSPQIAIHRDFKAPAGYVIHATFPRDSDGDGPDDSDVYYRRSVDGGSVWSAPVKLNDDATNTDQWFPSIGVNQFGYVVVSWYDRRRDPLNNFRFDRFAVVSQNGGMSWGPNKRISDVSSPVSQNNPHFDGLSRCYHGDYDQLAVGLFQAHILWSDDRRIVAPHGPDPDIWFDNLLLFGWHKLAGLD